jgi:hypothetical protein
VEEHGGKHLAWIIQNIFWGRIINWQNNYFEKKNRQITAAKNECFACGFQLAFFRLMILPENYSAICL